jgi:hypothetical protein
MPVSDRRNLASAVRKVEFKLLRPKFVSFFSSVYQPLPPFDVNWLPLNVSSLRPALFRCVSEAYSGTVSMKI